MQFNSEANNQDIVSDIKFLLTGRYDGSIDYHINDITRNVNRRYDDAATLIMRADGRWQWDDDNYDTLPIATTDLIDGQQDYELSALAFLELVEVAVKLANGTWRVLIPVDRNKGNSQELTDLEDGTDGLPKYYDKIGHSILLYAAPSSSYVVTGTDSDSLRVTCKRIPSYFAVTDTTKTPGFAPLYHRVLSIGAAIDFCIANGWSKKQVVLDRELQRVNDGMVSFYAARAKDDQVRLGLASEDYGGSSSYQGRSEDSFNI